MIVGQWKIILIATPKKKQRKRPIIVGTALKIVTILVPKKKKKKKKTEEKRLSPKKKKFHVTKDKGYYNNGLTKKTAKLKGESGLKEFLKLAYWQELKPNMGFQEKCQHKLRITFIEGDGFQADELAQERYTYRFFMRNDPPPQNNNNMHRCMLE